ncbi:hypothetical protein [Neobacillus cucumis]|uniref:hypothetical protein n=1 Tax=Neobacillus cucumis TaxID=1740721 RepID=UPI002E22796B|nr:hypothetical protein [Neobacillus cucumis]
MKKLSGIILAGAMALSMGTQAFAAETNNGNHYGWEKGTNNPHKSEVTPPEVVIENTTENTVSQEEINAIINDLNHSESLNQYSTHNARYENGWIKVDNILFSPMFYYDMQMNAIYDILDKHNVQQIAYTTENVQWAQGEDGLIGTDHWGTVCIKIDKK